MKLNKKSGLIALVLVAAIALMGFGFAAWSTTLTATGVVDAEATWLVQWKACEVSKSDCGTVVVSDTEISTTTTTYDTLDLGAVTFSLPGAWVCYHVTIENAGTIDATLTTDTIEVTGITDENILVDIPDSICGEIVTPGGTCEFDIVLQLDPDFDEEELLISAQNISLVLDYEATLSPSDVPTAGHTV